MFLFMVHHSHLLRGCRRCTFVAHVFLSRCFTTTLSCLCGYLEVRTVGWDTSLSGAVRFCSGRVIGLRVNSLVGWCYRLPKCFRGQWQLCSSM